MTTKKFIKAKNINEEVILEFGLYHDGTPALQLFSEFEGLVATATVNLGDYGFTPAPGNIIVKDYSENEGLLQGLLDAGVITQVIQSFSFGWVQNGAHECELAEEFKVEVQS